LEQTQSVGDALGVLYANDILSAPILNEETRVCMGNIDVLDLLAYVLSVPLDSSTWATEIALRFKTSIYRVVDFSKKDPFIPVLESTTLMDEISSHFQMGVHRVPIVNVSNTIVGILSQFDVLEFLLSKMEEGNYKDLNDLGKKNIQEIPYTSKVVSVPITASLLTAFELMSANRLHGVAVVNEKGVLAGNVSASDFKAISQNNFYSMGVILQQYLTVPPLVVWQTSTFFDALDIMSKNRVHRVYVVNDNMNPIGIITLTDVMFILVCQMSTVLTGRK